MNKHIVLLLIAILAACNISIAQETGENVLKSNVPQKDLYFGVGLGFTSESFVPINLHVQYKKMYYGLSTALPVSKGTEGTKYDNINWDEIPEDHEGEGSYYTPITFDLGYSIKSLVVGIGVGPAMKTKYRNCYDDYHILGDNGAYYIEAKDGVSADYKAFIKYRFKSQMGIHLYLSAQYTYRTGVGVVLGFEL